MYLSVGMRRQHRVGNGPQFEGSTMKRKPTKANSKELPGEYAKLPPKVVKQRKAKTVRTDSEKQLRLDVEQMINRAVDRANKRANGQR